MKLCRQSKRGEDSLACSQPPCTLSAQRNTSYTLTGRLLAGDALRLCAAVILALSLVPSPLVGASTVREAAAPPLLSPTWVARILQGQLTNLTRTRAAFDVHLDPRSGGLISAQHILCGPADGPPADNGADQGDSDVSSSGSDSAFVRSARVACGNVTGGSGERQWVHVKQRIEWSTILPPGVSRAPRAERAAATTAARSPADVFYACAMFGCDMQNRIPSVFPTEGGPRVVHLPDAYGGLSPATPCCGSTNSSLILFTPAPPSGNVTDAHTPARGLLVQTDVLPILYLQAHAQRILDEAFCGTAGCRAPAGKCAIRLLNARLSSPGGAISAWNGDGGLVFPATVSMCEADLSDVISSSASAALLRRGYSVLLTAREHADTVSLPRELIRSVGSWLAAVRGGTATDMLHAPASRCAWRFDASAVSSYRTGDYLVCNLDPSLVGHLPPLTITVRSDSVLSAYDTVGNGQPRGPCAFSIDLNRFIEPRNASRGGGGEDPARATPSSHQLILYASGSLTEAMGAANLRRFREPFIGVGLMFLQAATVAVTRAPSFLEPPRGRPATVPPDVLGMPVLFLAAHNRPLAEADKASGPSAATTAVCTAPVTCALDEQYYPSLNLCGVTGCVGVFAYKFNPVTMKCSLRPSFIAVFSVFAVVLIVADVALLLIGRWTERQRDAHTKLMEQVQRKNN